MKIVLGIVAALALVFYLFSYVSALHQPCEGGHILKNVYDWPVCVK